MRPQDTVSEYLARVGDATLLHFRYDDPSGGPPASSEDGVIALAVVVDDLFGWLGADPDARPHYGRIVEAQVDGDEVVVTLGNASGDEIEIVLSPLWTPEHREIVPSRP
jgi:hypothetical protein